MMPAVRVQVSPTLPPRAYSISVHEIPAGQAQIPHEHMSVAPSEVAEHIEKLVERHASSFVGLQETQTMIEQVERTYPALVRNAIPKPVALPLLTDILKRLAEEGVSIRPMREILETLAIYAANERDPITLTELVRASLRAHICSRFTRENALSALLVDHAIEDAIRHSIQRSATGTYLAMPPAQAKEVIQAVRATYSPDRRSSAPPVIALTQADVRRFFRKLIENDVPDLAVLSYNEIPADVTVQPVGHIRVGSQRP